MEHGVDRVHVQSIAHDRRFEAREFMFEPLYLVAESLIGRGGFDTECAGDRGPGCAPVAGVGDRWRGVFTDGIQESDDQQRPALFEWLKAFPAWVCGVALQEQFDERFWGSEAFCRSGGEPVCSDEACCVDSGVGDGCVRAGEFVGGEVVEHGVDVSVLWCAGAMPPYPGMKDTPCMLVRRSLIFWV